MAYSGIFTPRNPKKYLGDPTNIVYRSLWERKLMVMLDEREDVIAWGSEELKLPYRSPLDNRIHHYYPDMIAKMKKADGSTFIRMIEVKPLKETMPPIKPKERKTSKRYIREVSTYLVNQAKWNAAEAFCQDRGWEFTKITEEQLFPKQPK